GVARPELGQRHPGQRRRGGPWRRRPSPRRRQHQRRRLDPAGRPGASVLTGLLPSPTGAQASMPTLLQIAAAARRAGAHLASTPVRRRLALGASWLLTLLFFLAVRSGAQRHQAAVKTVGQDSVPSIIAAQKIKSALADMHASAANLLLHRPGEGKQVAADYEK